MFSAENPFSTIPAPNMSGLALHHSAFAGNMSTHSSAGSQLHLSSPRDNVHDMIGNTEMGEDQNKM